MKREDVREMFAPVVHFEEIKQHEDCLFRALRDMVRARDLMELEHARWLNAPGAKGAFRSGHASTRAWAHANALKHERELRAIDGYVMPEYLRTLFKDAGL